MPINNFYKKLKSRSRIKTKLININARTHTHEPGIGDPGAVRGPERGWDELSGDRDPSFQHPSIRASKHQNNFQLTAQRSVKGRRRAQAVCICICGMYNPYSCICVSTRLHLAKRIGQNEKLKRQLQPHNEVLHSIHLSLFCLSLFLFCYFFFASFSWAFSWWLVTRLVTAAAACCEKVYKNLQQNRTLHINKNAKNTLTQIHVQIVMLLYIGGA